MRVSSRTTRRDGEMRDIQSIRKDSLYTNVSNHLHEMRQNSSPVPARACVTKRREGHEKQWRLWIEHDPRLKCFDVIRWDGE